ncbi:Mss4p nuclear export [Coelomomyces lativittatus]|nr:Mss4p nuclear export [Coelomomyces lativittatus]
MTGIFCLMKLGISSLTLMPFDDILNVEFDFFEFDEADYHPIKQFLHSSFGKENTKIAFSELVDWILQFGLGTTVKCDGEKGDPYAFISILGLTGETWKVFALYLNFPLPILRTAL